MTQTFFCTREDLQQILKLITSEISKLKRWSESNELSLHLSKTKIMLFGNCKSIIKYRLRRMVQILKDFMYIHFKNQLETSHTKHVQSQLSQSISVKNQCTVSSVHWTVWRSGVTPTKALYLSTTSVDVLF